MPADSALRGLAALVGAFYITDKPMRRAQEQLEALLAQGEADEGARAAYLAAVNRYFSSFEREARSHLRTLDRRLAELNQIQFNLTAERGVAVKRIEGTRAVLEAAAHLERERTPQ